MIWLELIVAAACIGGGLSVWWLGRAHAWRWGLVPGTAVEAGTGPYRHALTAPEVPRGIPAVVSWAAGTGVAWGVLTLFVFMPAGFLLLLAVADDPRLSGGVGVLSATLLLLAACDGVILGIALLSMVAPVLRGGAEGARCARGTARWSVLHHLVVVATFVCFAAVLDDWYLLALATTVPCLIGLAHAGLLERAARACESAAAT